MVDFAIDYNNLHTIQSKLRALAEKADTGTPGAFRDLGEALAGERKAALGSSSLSYAFNNFYHHSKSRTGKAKEGLNELADTFKAVSDVFFDGDAKISAAAGLMTKSLGIDQWRDTKAAHDKWLADKAKWDEYLAGIGATGFFRDHPEESIRHTCHGPDAPAWCAAWKAKGEDSAPPNPGDEPPKPADKPPTSYHHQDEHGTIDVNVELDENNNIIKETSKITNPQGQGYETTTTYKGPPEWVDIEDGKDRGKDPDKFDVRDYTITTKYGDGTTSTSVYTINQDGGGTMITTAGDKTEHYLRKGPRGEWERDPAYADADAGPGKKGNTGVDKPPPGGHVLI
ncbi:serine/arginine repetitive matrix protein 2 [Streptomyces sp. SID3343]|uniref:serine/arginine repetitive matrix protein 2 n=1 Tax=Streptomyces sp. SID3343 TaxID=2690260 RepID=UPI00137176F8|nr:serine/arginine repetitive matrix protein 2 [Streptomyces sp. SID3343]MYW00157.1 serine/arginine repetitive matrix protein 2 [Streptomyces sp. SID3343]